MADSTAKDTDPASLAELHLPPTFVTEHAIRTLSYQGSMSAAEMARHWRVHDTVALETVESLKAAGLIEFDSQASFELAGRVRLNDAGLARVAAARQRTWYAGPLPVALSDFERRMDVADARIDAVRLDRDLRALAIDAAAAAEMGQAVCGGVTLALAGLAPDEQAQVAAALAGALTNDVSIPFAMYASGAIVRVFDARYHQPRQSRPQDGTGLDVRRSRGDVAQWVPVSRPVVILSGGVQTDDVLPAFDEEAKFYVAPAPFAACGGLLVVLDADSNPAGLAELARLWLVPGRHEAGVIRLRSGERIEVPWHASTLLLGATAAALPAHLRVGLVYMLDVSDLRDEALTAFIALRLPERAFFPAAVINALAEALARSGVATRARASRATLYLRNRVAYTGIPLSVDTDTLRRAVDFASSGDPGPGHQLSAA
jgi:hypothetical protein